jgi:hypothetical protein
VAGAEAVIGSDLKVHGVEGIASTNRSRSLRTGNMQGLLPISRCPIWAAAFFHGDLLCTPLARAFVSAPSQSASYCVPSC